MPALRIDRLSRNFGGLQVLEDISLSVEEGERVAIIGPNGAGKTTLLNIITGELSASAGQLYLFGQRVTRLSADRRVRKGLGRSFQITRVFYELTVLDNVSLALQGVRSSRYQMLRGAATYDEVFGEAERLLTAVDLWHKKDEGAAGISYGEQRRLEIVLALASKPRVLLMDEPSAGLAAAEIGDFINTIKVLARDATLVFTAHDMDVVFALASRIIVLYFGRIIADGSPELIRTDPKVREIYFGTKAGR